MVGFCFAIPGVKPNGQAYLHSHMLGVLPEYRNSGIGRRLKLRQRDEALARGIKLIEWTFDPLELKNAFFNIERLGAIVRRYSENQYGVTQSPLHGGLPTDRCIAEWWIDSPRVRRVLAGGACRARGRWSGSRTRRISRASAPKTRDCARADPARQRAEVHGRVRARPGGDGVRAQRDAWDLFAGAIRMKLERIVLRQIQMPLVHFFETSFSRTYKRDIILVEAQGDGISGWGEVTAGENPFYNEEWTGSAWLVLRDYAAPRVVGREIESARDVAPLTRAHSRAPDGARRPGNRGLGPGSPARRRAAVEEDRRRRAARDPLRRFHRHSGFGGAVAREDRVRTGRRLPAHQDQDQAGLGRGRGAARARALSRISS